MKPFTQVLPVFTGSIEPGNKKTYELDDPMSLEGIFIPHNDPEAMAEAYIREFATLGYTEDFIVELFKKPVYAGTYRFLRLWGEVKTRDFIRRVLKNTVTLNHAIEYIGEGD